MLNIAVSVKLRAVKQLFNKFSTKPFLFVVTTNKITNIGPCENTAFSMMLSKIRRFQLQFTGVGHIKFGELHDVRRGI